MSEGPSTLAPRQRRPDWAALLIAVGLVAIAAVIFFDSARLASVTGYSPVGPATVPYAIGFCLIGLSLWTAIEAWRGDFPQRDKQEIAPVIWVIAGLAAQMLLLKLSLPAGPFERLFV